ncbi:DsbA family protein [Arthrobacter sp. zg-Y20]|uniref:DsbA family protein n=1 Tax=unclassified Arthrobacter TaxID=235627 RepID=UPI001D1395DE|nr:MULTISPECIES: thioredoxin domain-containing protein [unclassified Arthrobacter]MCC3276726.1 DsbA family protein [Arthrobacter sp. zg-Y20]MDK1316885.1 thioredoxin domain-containing protein [Arthrobacter sp. zg.Y20]WIB06705.1 thioredoxin domain-containing protein [Arthrobacter sp. zg-Y20]
MTDRNLKPTKSERTAAAREQARAMREAQQKKEHRNRLLIRWGVVVAILAVVALVAAIVVNNVNSKVPSSGESPANANEYGGFTLTSTSALEPTEPFDVDVDSLGEAPDQADENAPVPPGITAGEPGQPIPLVEYVDINCVHCADFAATYDDQIAKWLDAGEITYEYRTVAFLDGGSPTNYSSRGANAAACVASESPESYWDFMKAIFAQHANGEVDNAGLVDMAAAAGADADAVESCIDDGTYRPFVKYADQMARIDGISGTPTAFVNGSEADLNTFVETVQAAIDANK